MTGREFTIRAASAPAELDAARELFQEFVTWTRLDLSFQGFAAELAGLPGYYGPPGGRLFVAWSGGRPAGCIALRALGNSGEAELKRMYVRPDYRGWGIGRALVAQVVADARSIGYTAIKLDTLPTMDSAIRLYESIGFKRCAAYYPTPIPDTVFMNLDLRARQ